MKRLILLISALALTSLANAQYHQTTLYDSTQVVMEESGLSHVYIHRLIRMDDLIGCRDNNVIKVDYDPLSAYVDIQQVIVHYNQGPSDTINAPVVYDYVAPARLIYWGASQKMVEVGRLSPGDQLEYRIYRKGFTYALLQDDDSRYIPPMRGHFYDIVPFWSSQPVDFKYYSVKCLTSKNLQYHVYNGTLETSEKKEGNHTIYSFSKHNIKPIKHEQGMLANNDIECKLLLSTSPNWEAKSMWFYGVNEDYGSFLPTPELKDKVNQLIGNAKDELDSISILTHWVADNMRYAGISMGEGEGYTLHNAQMNFTDRCGVCKDKAGLLIAMLRAAGFKAYAAMTMAGERIDRIPADQFNHSVCVVQRHNGEYQLLDPTWVPNVRELWSSAEQQQGYLMGLPNGADLMETPISPAENHYIKIHSRSVIQKDGSLWGKITITAEGQSDNAVRRVFTRQADWDNALESELLKIAPNAEVLKIETTDPDKYLEQPVSITYEFQIPDFAIVSRDQCIFRPLATRNFFARAMTHLNYDVTQEKQYPFADACSRLIDVKDTIEMPYYYHNYEYPVPQEINSTVGSFSAQAGQLYNMVYISERIQLNKRKYEASDWQDFRNIVNNQKQVANTNIIVTRK